MRFHHLGFLAALCTAPAIADVKLPAAFTDHMVIQRNQPFRVWGMAQQGEQITVELRDAKSALIRSSKQMANATGTFSMEFPALVASADPMTLEVRGANSVTIKDVVVGDVWIAGGQSNMEWRLAETDEQAAAGVAVANDPLVRFLRAPHVTANRPAFTVDAAWRVLSPDSAPGMGAVAFWFARDVRKETGVPIGILEINWSGTRAEPWTDTATLSGDPLYASRVAELRKAIDNWYSRSPRERAAEIEVARKRFQEAGTAWWSQVNAEDPGAKGAWFAAGEPKEPEAWSTVTMPLAWGKDDSRREFDGIEWYRRNVEIPAEWEGKDCLIELGTIDDADIVFVNGRAIANTIGDIGTGRKYRVPAAIMKKGSCTIAVEMLDLHGEGGFGSGPEAMRMTCPTGGDAVISLAGEWLARRGRSAKDIPGPPSRPSKEEAPGTGYGDPASMFNGMIAPFDDLKVKGAIWYQGESNAGSVEDAEAYRTLLPLTIRSWRGAFEEPDMPFGIVSLAAFQPFQPEKPLHGNWPILRDSQLATERNSPNTGVITTIDVGDADDIHPRNKRSVGERLARWAIAVAYGNQDMAWRGPRTKSARRDADGIVIDFDAERGRLATRDGKEPMGFALAGADGVFHIADAVLLPPTGIRVRSAKVVEPVEIRYGWQDNPASSNLIDEVSKLPAHPFRIRVEADPVQSVPGAKPAK
jgi:sialate O-acetylesterase